MCTRMYIYTYMYTYTSLSLSLCLFFVLSMRLGSGFRCPLKLRLKCSWMQKLGPRRGTRAPSVRRPSDPRLRPCRGAPSIQTLRVQSAQMWGIYGFYIRNRNYGFGNLLCIWVLGPLGKQYISWNSKVPSSTPPPIPTWGPDRPKI